MNYAVIAVASLIVLGFSFTGDVLPAGDFIMLTLGFEGEQGDEICLSNVVLSNSEGEPIFTETGDCVTLDLIIPGDVNFDEEINVVDIVLIVNFVLNTIIPTEEEALTADINQDGILNILDVINLVSQIIGLTFGQSVDWLRENFPELEVDRRLGELDKSIHFSK